MTNLKQLDAENRIRALELTSFIVEAPAGAGKTELLMQRYLKLLSVVDAPEEIIALTFTNKAAAEMRNRILQSLLDCENKTRVNEPHKQQTRKLAEAALAHAKQRGWQLLTQPSRLRIMTIDALCGSLARQMPLLSRLGGQPRVSDDMDVHYAQAAQRAIADVATETSLEAHVSKVLSFMQNDAQKLEKLLANMLEKREQWLPLTGQQTALTSAEISAQCQKTLKKCIEEKLQAALKSVPASTQTLLMSAVRFAASNLDQNHLLRDWAMPLQANIDGLASWLTLRQFLIKKDGDFREASGLNSKVGFAKHPDKEKHVQTFCEVCAQIANPQALVALDDLPLVSAEEMDENSAIVQAFSALLQRAAAHLWTVFQAAGEVDFVAIAQSAIRALENEQGATDLALKLDYKISHLLVDEFQDTNSTQIQLIQQLAQGWQNDDGRTLFCVGDPMQSIYRFRKADVSLFLQAAEQGIGQIQLKALKLSLNNRSQPKVVAWINTSFAHIFPAQDNETEAAIQYRPFIATKNGDADEGVEVHPLLLGSDEESADAIAAESRYVADLIEKERKAKPAQSIAVLTRSRQHLHKLISEIRQNYQHLKFQAVKFERLDKRQTVQDALSLTRAMLHRADRIHWLNLLRAPWCGLTLGDLHALCADNHHATIWQLMHEKQVSEDGQTRLNHVKTVLAEAFAAQGRMPLRRWLETTWLKLGGANTLINAGDNRDIQAFFNLVEKLSQGYALDFAQLETAMTKLYAEPDIEADGKLLFLTIQESKGLEFDCVILPALNRKPPNHDSPLMLWEKVNVNGKPQLLAAPYAKKSENPNIYDYIKTLEAKRANNEIARLLYVAATRTVRKLHLVATLKASQNGLKPVGNSFLALLWPTVETQFLAAKVKDSNAQPSANLSAFTPKLMRLPNVDSPLALTQSTANRFNPPMQAKPSALNLAADCGTSLNLAADCGTLAHLYMEIIANAGLKHWPASRMDACLQAMCFWLKQRGYDAKIANQAATEVAAALKTTIESADGKWVLQQRENQRAEYALSTAEAQHKIDCTFVEKNVRWIIDYKLTQANDSADLQALALTHQAQLNRYETLFLHENLPIKKAVFFLTIGKLVEI